ncbi:hypothetical protein [Novosphingobium sp. P6W]|uniref:hypothetical protein n=1 Tax=Novosphingobium sp. P6W TaxID=1609758 RepID=UPI0005C2E064|nr:hypothetical protein [Novosphingobium sp. P6W]AXB76427.1 hypothetical protein TQ38_007835 [Novosphingobium sp. P6W]KIS32072.1 hypothetical protein TQ38_12950 [Novosphingobium sp. P6W]
MAEGYSTQLPNRNLKFSVAVAIRGLRGALAGFFPVAVFALVLVWAIAAWGLVAGIMLGSVLAGVVAWGVVRTMSAYPSLQWLAATAVGTVLILFVVSIFQAP